MIRGKQQWSAVSADGSGLDGFANASFSQFWTTKSVTSGVSDAYIEPDANRQILSVQCAYAQGGRAVL